VGPRAVLDAVKRKIPGLAGNRTPFISEAKYVTKIKFRHELNRLAKTLYKLFTSRYPNSVMLVAKYI
jgi:hypothetical protein